MSSIHDIVNKLSNKAEGIIQSSKDYERKYKKILNDLKLAKCNNSEAIREYSNTLEYIIRNNQHKKQIELTWMKIFNNESTTNQLKNE
uniref:DUF1311 domain-containing protein n=1 Tax=Parastrongyloides trichosuri TaxID=131310 RepID=A0A0N5A5Q3_PARTI